jgi:hypothetical protein
MGGREKGGGHLMRMRREAEIEEKGEVIWGGGEEVGDDVKEQ